jgi:hypothetical protein
VFKFPPMLPDGGAPDPAVFVTAVPNWHEGDAFMPSSGARYRILGINENVDETGLEELYQRGINAIWMVEPARSG